MTLAGTAVVTFAAVLLVTGLTGGCDSGTDTAHLDQPRAVSPQPDPQPVLHIGDSVTWRTP